MSLIQLIDPANIAAGVPVNTLTDVVGINRAQSWAAALAAGQQPNRLVPNANFVYDSVNLLWVPQQAGAGGVILADVVRENDYSMVTVSLTGARVAMTEIFLPGPVAIAGRSITVYQSTGAFNFALNDATVGVGDAIPVQILLWPNMFTIEQDFTNLYVQNLAQPNLQVIFRIGRRV